MSRRSATRWLLLGTLLVVPAARAADVPPEKMAQVKADEDKAMAKIDDAHGHKKASEMSSDERKELIEQRQKASLEAAEKNGVSPKDYARASAQMKGDQRSQMEAAEKRIEAKEKAD